ncbi:MAG: CDP-alcohol phosphatidyltransferase [Homoserinimonas sp.]|nr:CDP-alcohol phosphatidyltransferase [Homoserinimonas sp.]
MTGQLNTIPERHFSTALSALDHAQKPGGGVPAYTRWVNRRLARYAAAAAYSWGWSPNMVTLASAVVSLSALTLIVGVEPTPLLGITVAALLALGYLLDSADGQVARLGGRGSKQGEWLDHVVDAVRTPAIHLAVLVGLWRFTPESAWPLVIALAYVLVSGGQFMSQILAEQLSGEGNRPPFTGGVPQSVLLIPTDMGTLCWIFLVWGFPPAFVIVYAAMFVANAVHTAISMRRKYLRLARTGEPWEVKVVTS